MFGQTYMNVGSGSIYLEQKAFVVDGVLYNVVAIDTLPTVNSNCIKYITFRQKLPKFDIKYFDLELEAWDAGVTLPEMPPFNEEHRIYWDVQKTWTTPYSQQDKIGNKVKVDPLVVRWVDEKKEERFKGALKEIYNQTADNDSEYWNEEWFWTRPWQYTSFELPADQLYLVTLAWRAPQAEACIWDGTGKIADIMPPYSPAAMPRVKFWYDPGVNVDLYVNRLGELPAAPAIADFFDLATNGGNGNGQIDLTELVNAILAYLNNQYPFVDGQFGKADLLDLLQEYIDTQ
jgi:hypothetical protein